MMKEPSGTSVIKQKPNFVGRYIEEEDLNCIFEELAKEKSFKKPTAGEKLVWIRCIKSFKSISPVK